MDGAHQLGPSDPNGAETDIPDIQRIFPALIAQGSCPAAGTDNKTCADDVKVDSARLWMGLDTAPGLRTGLD